MTSDLSPDLHPDIEIVREPGLYKVGLPKLPRDRYRKYIVVRGDSDSDAIRNAINIVEADRDFRIWIHPSECEILAVITEPIRETVGDARARRERALARAVEARARRLDRSI